MIDRPTSGLEERREVERQMESEKNYGGMREIGRRVNGESEKDKGARETDE